MRITEGGELSGAAVQVDKTWAECWQETEAVINCNDTKQLSDFILNWVECRKMKMKLDWLTKSSSSIKSCARDKTGSEHLIRINSCEREKMMDWTVSHKIREGGGRTARMDGPWRQVI